MNGIQQKNDNVNPYTITSGSDIRAWWVCKHGHEWTTRINKRTTKNQGCPVCANRMLHIDNCLATVRPELASEWHNEKNFPLTPFDVVYVQNIKVWWVCKHGHEWGATVRHRSVNGSDCHYCSHQKTLKEDSIAYLRPDLMTEWHYEKNEAIHPEEIPLSSTKLVWWQCNQGHEWQKKVHSKELFCPVCNSLEYQRPDLMEEWSDDNTLSPKKVSPCSHKKALWICKQGHKWEERISTRSGREHPNCPICTSIVFTHPHLLKEWDKEKNEGLNPYDFTSGSNRKIWWQCEQGHIWKTTIAHRALRHHGCPHCNRTQTSFPEKFIAYGLSTVFSKVENRIKIENTEADIYIPAHKIAIEYDGTRWHKDKTEKDCLKNKVFQQNGITIIHVREEGLESLPNVKNFSIVKYPNETHLHEVCEKLVQYISELIGQPLVYDVSKVSAIDVLKYISFQKKENSLEQTHPELCLEWDSTKNGALKPIHFTYEVSVIPKKCGGLANKVISGIKKFQNVLKVKDVPPLLFREKSM